MSRCSGVVQKVVYCPGRNDSSITCGRCFVASIQFDSYGSVQNNDDFQRIDMNVRGRSTTRRHPSVGHRDHSAGCRSRHGYGVNVTTEPDLRGLVLSKDLWCPSPNSVIVLRGHRVPLDDWTGGFAPEDAITSKVKK